MKIIYCLVFYFLFFQGHAAAQKLVITKKMAEACAEFKGQPKNFQACLLRQGAKVEGEKTKKPKKVSPPKEQKPSKQETKGPEKKSRASASSRFADLKPPLVEDITFSMFTGGSDGACSHTVPAKAFCSDTLCIIWQKSNKMAVPSTDKMAKLLHLIDTYRVFGTEVMNYKPNLLSLEDKVFTGQDGKKRQWTIELADYYCGNYGGASYNGRAWNALPKDMMIKLIDSLDNDPPIMPQVALYEMGRSMYNLKFDDILDWQMQEASQYGFWALGFNGALTVLAPESLNLKLDYNGYDDDLERFRRERLTDIQTYIDDKKWNFDNAWSVWLLPWSQGQSINDMMTGLILMLTDRFGGVAYLKELTKFLLKQPATPNKTDRKERATNFYRAAKQAAQSLNGNGADVEKFFKQTLRWTFLPK